MSERIECRDLCKAFGEKVILDHINLTLPRGRIVGLLGKNGAGKSTLMKLINDLLTPTAGQVLFEGKPIGVESKRRIAYLPERTYLDRSFTVEQTLKKFADFYDNFSMERANDLLRKLDLDPTAKISSFSKGMKEKLQLCLVMARKADLYVLDEPLGGVDPATRDYILDTILSNFEEGATMLISTHLITDVERIFDDVIMIDGGKIVLSGNADDIRLSEGGTIDEIFRRKFSC